MDFANGETWFERLRLIASATDQGPLIAGSSFAISRRRNWGEGDEPKLHPKISAIAEIHQWFKKRHR